MTAPLFKYPGAKTRHVKTMMEYRPPEASHIIDLFCGSCAFGIGAREHFPDAVLVLNDTDKDLVNALLAIRDYPEALADLLEHTPYSRSLFYDLRKSEPLLYDIKDDSLDGPAFQAALDFIIMNRQSVGGALRHTGTGWSRDQAGQKVRQWSKVAEKLRAFSRLICQSSVIECLDFQECLFGNTSRRAFGWDRETAFIYMDPPYAGKEMYYGSEKGAEFHAQVAEAANRCTGRVMVSYMIDDAFMEHVAPHYPQPAWCWIEYEAVQYIQNAKKGGEQDRRTEVLLLNY